MSLPPPPPWAPPAATPPPRRSRLGCILGAVIGGLMLIAVVAAVLLVRNWHPSNALELCPAPRQMLNAVAGSLEQEFQIREASPYCSGEVPTDIKASGVVTYLSAKNEEFNTDQQVRERVVQALINSGVGWQQTGDGELAATVKGVGFTAEARTISYRPALARLVISEVRKGRGSLGTSMYPTRYLSTEEMLPFSPLPVLKSSVVPPGFSGWGEAWVDLARPSSSVKLLRNGEKYSPTMVVDRLGEPGCFTARGKPDPQAGCRRVGRTSQGPILRLPNSPDLTTIHDGHVVRLVGVWDYPAVDPWLSHQQAIGILRHLEVLQPAALSDGS